ncbi:uncharacterized protein LOC114332032 isoform X1 [Diabrotica virgifera virgifera]|uniref:Potassium channel domain-containing protein n=1 Tax=Diabrotica virgifera virgifera TaxID=50390 RepID=A0ABM5INP7_DIAVI|nr:uncharacterized protein LOC114332032 isoform X1 [Diabrotica virgifera virgifera]
MDSMPTSREKSEVNCVNNESEKIDIEKIKNLLTEEQVHSDTIARRRRRFTKKRSTSLTRRDPTPVRNLDDKFTSDEEPVEPKPKTPERPRRPKRNKSLIKHNLSETDTPSVEDSNKSNNVSRNNSFRTKLKRFEAQLKAIETNAPRKKSLSDLAQDEVVALFTKTKKTITNAAIKGRERFRNNKEVAKRSQSAPNKIVDQEFNKHVQSGEQMEQLLQEKPRKYSESDMIVERPRKYSETSLQTTMQDIEFSGPIIKKAKALRRESPSGLRHRKKPEYSSKVVEILDPRTLSVVSRKTVVRLPQVKLRDLYKILRFYSIFEIIRAYRLYKVEMRTEYKKIKTLWNKCMFELFLIMMFCGAAGFIFKFTEGKFENFYKCGVKRVKRDFIDLLWSKSHNLREDDWKSLFRNKLKTFEEELHAAHEAGMTSYSGQRSWSFLNSVVYALTIVTTIGYGHLYPSTTTGRALTIVYAIVGIPLFLIALTDFGKLFTRAIKFLWSFVRRLYYTGSCRKVRKSATASEIFKGAQMMYGIATFRRPSKDPSAESAASPFSTDITSIKPMSSHDTVISAMSEDTPTTPDLSTFEIDDEFNLPISVALFILVAYMFIGALVYCAWEGWEFFTSFYFVFISLSTIGFGDFIPAQPVVLIVSIVYLVFGLALMSMCINVVQVKLSDTFQQASIKLSSTMGFEMPDSGMTLNEDETDVVQVHKDVEKNEDEVKSEKIEVENNNSATVDKPESEKSQ